MCLHMCMWSYMSQGMVCINVWCFFCGRVGMEHLCKEGGDRRKGRYDLHKGGIRPFRELFLNISLSIQNSDLSFIWKNHKKFLGGKAQKTFLGRSTKLFFCIFQSFIVPFFHNWMPFLFLHVLLQSIFVSHNLFLSSWIKLFPGNSVMFIFEALFC